MSGIEVKQSEETPDGFAFRVVVSDGDSSSTHEVTLSKQDHERLAGDRAPEEFVKRCFEFLLERESKESILVRFDVSVIGRYFPEFEEAIAP